MNQIVAAAILVAITTCAHARDPKVVRDFKRAKPCPIAELRPGCKGFEVDHIIPLCAGGRDTPDNLQWLAVRDHRDKTRADVALCRAYKKVQP